MLTVITIDPVTRLEGHLKVKISYEGPAESQTVVDAHVSGTLFRGFEELLIGRDPWDAPHLTQRICGVCPLPHAMASVLALEEAAGQTIPPNGRILRNLVTGANFLHSHIFHFYMLSLLDYISGPRVPPWIPEWDQDRRMSRDATERLLANYRTALRMSRIAQEMTAVFSGRMPHSPAFIPGGFTAIPEARQIEQFIAYGRELLGFIQDVYVEDVELLADSYPEYEQLGRGYGNLMSVGGFPTRNDPESHLFKSGIIRAGQGTVEEFKPSAIAEQVDYSRYDTSSGPLEPANGITRPAPEKSNAYSWIKAPRYLGEPFETGPLARLWINGAYSRGISVMDRHRARAQEAVLLVKAMLSWALELEPGQPACARYSTPQNATAAGLTEAPRGALGHWSRIQKGKIACYQIITPTSWNGSPRDGAGHLGPMEQALVGLSVQNPDQPIEALRLIHSFDPCLACAVH